MNDQSDYLKYRGKCKEMSEEACKQDLSLILVRGYYYCPIWNTKELHWWTKRDDGTIFDPTAKQFPSAGNGIYTEFDGIFNCSNCDKEITEEEGIKESNYIFCSGSCYGRFVGVF